MENSECVGPCSSSILPKGPLRGCLPRGTRIAPPPFPPDPASFLAVCSRLEEEDTLLSGPSRIGNLVSAGAPEVACEKSKQRRVHQLEQTPVCDLDWEQTPICVLNWLTNQRDVCVLTLHSHFGFVLLILQ